MCKNIPAIRTEKAHKQKWLCFYCNLPMTGKGSPYAGIIQNRIRCLQVTAEHLIAQQDGGTDSPDNIVAVHALCNQRRHRRNKPLSPIDFAVLVGGRIARQRWFDRSILNLLSTTKLQQQLA